MSSAILLPLGEMVIAFFVGFVMDKSKQWIFTNNWRKLIKFYL